MGRLRGRTSSWERPRKPPPARRAPRGILGAFRRSGTWLRIRRRSFGREASCRTWSTTTFRTLSGFARPSRYGTGRRLSGSSSVRRSATTFASPSRTPAAAASSAGVSTAANRLAYRARRLPCLDHASRARPRDRHVARAAAEAEGPRPLADGLQREHQPQLQRSWRLASEPRRGTRYRAVRLPIPSLMVTKSQHASLRLPPAPDYGLCGSGCRLVNGRRPMPFEPALERAHTPMRNAYSSVC